MHILFLTDNFPPEVNAPASRTFEHCKEWVKKPNCSVTVITCFPNFPKGKVFKGYKNKLYQIENISGIKVIRVWSFITSNDGFFMRILDYLSFMFMAFFASFFIRKVDVIIGTSPQFFTAFSAFLVSLFKRVPWVFELRDIWPESIKVVGAMNDGLAISLLEKLELFLYRKASLIVPVTESFKKILESRGINPKKIKVITNGVDSSRFQPQKKDMNLVKRFNIKNKFVAGYIGTHGMAHGLETVIYAAHKISVSKYADKFHFILLGDGANKEYLIKLASSLNINNITFIDSVSKEEVPKYWSILDVSIVHLKKDPLFETVIPSKIFECMAMGIPMLYGVKGESASIVKNTQTGLLFEPESAEELIYSLKKISLNTNLYTKLASSGPSSVSMFDRKYLASKMFSQIKALKNKS